MSITDRIIKIRNILKLQQKQFADGLSISKSIINMIEKGERKPSRELLIKLADRYNVNITWILLGKGSIFIENDYKEVTISEAIPILKELSYLNEDDRKKVLDYIQQLRDGK